MNEHKIDVVLLQETHILDELQMTQRATISGYTLISVLYHRRYVKNYINNWSHLFSTWTDTACIIAIRVAKIIILNSQKYKLPHEIWLTPTLTAMLHSPVYSGDFSSYHTNWGYEINDTKVKSYIIV